MKEAKVVEIPLAATMAGMEGLGPMGAQMSGPLDVTGLPISPEMLAAIKLELSDAVATGIEEGVRRVRDENKTFLTIVVGAAVVSALAAVVTAILIASKG